MEPRIFQPLPGSSCLSRKVQSCRDPASMPWQVKQVMNEASDTIKFIKDRFPFRLGTTSYIVPADLMPNVVFLSPLVDDVELVLFESDTISNLPDAAVIRVTFTIFQTLPGLQEMPRGLPG